MSIGAGEFRCHTRQSRHDSRMVSVPAMVPNPIYDGPMYESIEPNFTDVRSSSLSSMGSRYVANITKTPESTESPDVDTKPGDIGPPADSPSLQMARTTRPKTPEEKNILQLTLTLNKEEEAMLHAGGSIDTERDSTKPSNSSIGSVPDIADENYAFMSPPMRMRYVQETGDTL